MGQRQNYEGPTWPREELLGELDRRHPWLKLNKEAFSDDDLRKMLINTYECHLPKVGDCWPRMKDDGGELPKVGERGPWMTTFTGKHFFPLAPYPEDFDRRDIAHSLALTCRFNGSLNQFYSVAQHSIILRKLLPDSLAAWALLHDAAEAYLGDLVRPIKHYWQFFSDAENHLLEVMAQAFHLPWPMPEELKRMDLSLALAEAEQFTCWSVPDDVLWPVPDDLILPLPDLTPFIGGSELCNWSWRAVESVFMRQLSQV